MERRDFDFCLEESIKMFNSKPLNSYVSNVFWDEFGTLSKDKFLKALAETSARGAKFTIDNVASALAVVNNKNPKKQIKTDCLKCEGSGAIVINAFAYSCCSCLAKGNYPNFPKYRGQRDLEHKATEWDGYILREFNGYKVKRPLGIKNVKELSFSHLKYPNLPYE